MTPVWKQLFRDWKALPHCLIAPLCPWEILPLGLDLLCMLLQQPSFLVPLVESSLSRHCSYFHDSVTCCGSRLPILGDASDSHRERLLLLHLVFSLPLGKSLLFGPPWSSSHLSFLISHPCLLLSCLKHPVNPSPNSSAQFIPLSFNKPRRSSFVPQRLFSLIASCF